MKSTIRVDFQGGDTSNKGFEPVIRVRLEDSDDVRDSLLKTFFQSLGGDSSWLRVHFESPESRVTNVTISPVKANELADLEKQVRERREILIEVGIGA